MIISGQKIFLKPFCFEDINEQYLRWLSDNEVMQYSNQRFVKHSLESCMLYLENFKNSDNLFLAIKLKENNKLEDIDNKSKNEIEIYKDQIKKQNHQNILEIRQVIQSYEDVGKIYLGGIPMIADDMMTFIKSDIIVFGIGVLLFIIKSTFAF